MKDRILEILAAFAVIVILAGVPPLVWWYEDYSLHDGHGEDVKIFKLTASAYQGRVTTANVAGYNYWSGRFPRLDTLRVNKGDRVVLVITSADVTHSFTVTPELDVKQPIEIEGGHTTEAEFLADKPGIYSFECSSFCGCAHHAMFFKIEVFDTPARNVRVGEIP